ncbi:MAG: dihydrolipoamide acetyltransferase family protein, partial [Candidatus Polarisedimenticolia bacterium]
AAVATQPVPAIPAAAPAAAPRGPVPAAPATRRFARELGIDINAVPGSGPGGRVGREDVERFAAAPAAAPAAPEEEVVAAPPAAIGAGIPFLEIEPLPDFAQEGPVEREPIRSIRRKVAKKMTTSMILVPHVAHIDEADVTTLDEFRRRERERRAGQPGARMSLLPFVVKAVAAGLAEFPMFNASLDPARGEIVYKKYYNVGVAVDSGHGLVVPVVRGADRKSVLEIAAEIEDLAARARAGKLDAAEMRGGTFTITNVGPLGGTALIPTINYPESAILGMATAKPKPVVHEGQIVARTILPLTLAFDHRVADGADAARFVGALVRRLSEPLSWLFTAK